VASTQQRKPKKLAPGSNPGASILCDDDVMQIGGHKGKPLRDVPDQALGWLWRPDGAGFCAFGRRVGYPGQLAEYIERRFEAKRATMPERRWPKYLHQRATHEHQ